MSIQINNSAQERAYYEKKYSTTPLAENKISYNVQSGESLWSISKKHLNKETASNAEIQDMMYAIAKLNNKSTIESANKIDIGETIYLPVYEQEKSVPKEKKDVKIRISETNEKIKKILYPNDEDKSIYTKDLARYTNADKIPEKLQEEHASAGLDFWTETLNDKSQNLKVEQRYRGTKAIAIVVQKQNKDGSNEQLYIQTDSDKKLNSVSFSTPGINIRDGVFDYDVDKNGNISTRRPLSTHSKKIGEIDKESLENFVNAAQKLVDQRAK